jgi:hypothetical protein
MIVGQIASVRQQGRIGFRSWQMLLHPANTREQEGLDDLAVRTQK